MSTETWYVLEGGEVGDPAEIAPDKSGVLRHKDGRAVAYASYGPLSRGGVNADAERAKAKQKTSTRDLKPEEQKVGYKTRDVKAG